MAERMSGKLARASAGKISKQCPNCGGGFIFVLTQHNPRAYSVIEDFIQMLARGEVQIRSVEDVEDELRRGTTRVHPLALESRGEEPVTGGNRSACRKRIAKNIHWPKRGNRS